VLEINAQYKNLVGKEVIIVGFGNVIEGDEWVDAVTFFYVDDETKIQYTCKKYVFEQEFKKSGGPFGNHSNIDAENIIENEGISYAVQHYISWKEFEDPKTRILWKNAEKALYELEEYLGIE